MTSHGHVLGAIPRRMLLEMILLNRGSRAIHAHELAMVR